MLISKNNKPGTTITKEVTSLLISISPRSLGHSGTGSTSPTTASWSTPSTCTLVNQYRPCQRNWSLSRCLLGKVEALLASSPWREGRSECGLTSMDWREAGSQGWTAGGSCNESGCLTYHPHQVRPLTQLHFCFSFPPFFVHKSSIIPRQEEH